MSEWLARPPDRLLLDHKTGVAANAKRFGGMWAGPWAELAGWWHDLGKFSDAFQIYIRAVAAGQEIIRGSVNHTSAGAIHAMRRLRASGLPPEAWHSLCAVILSHHGKLYDVERFEERLGYDDFGHPINPQAAADADRLYHDALSGSPPEWLVNWPIPSEAPQLWQPLFTRMLFSALVDGDRSDAGKLTPRVYPSMDVLMERYDRYMVETLKGADGPINDLRERARQECLANASLPPGIFFLDAPTGFGKTLASLGFALSHAKQYGHERIIYVAPFLTAIEQTAQVFRDALGDEDGTLVLEHHSTADRDLQATDDENEAQFLRSDPAASREERLRQRENWDAPVIITSNVQFFESLHAHDAGRCRKLHRVARAVVLIDEPQSLPTGFMAPIAKVMGELSAHYGASLALITATQPAFEKSRRFRAGLTSVRPLISAPLLAQMRPIASGRVNVSLPMWDGRREEWSEIAARIASYDQATLTIVNTKANARELYSEVKARDAGSPVFHLSAGMCVAHRKLVLDNIKRYLPDGLVKVVSTQVIEAGIDIDFPRVMRAMAGLDSLIQSAGRCNRNGKRKSPGEFEVFQPSCAVPLMFQHVEGLAKSLLQRGCPLFDVATMAEYYQRILGEGSTDSRAILKAQEKRNFTEVGRRFRLIDATENIVVPYGTGGQEAVRKLRLAAAAKHVTNLFDEIQNFSVSISKMQAETLAEFGSIEALPQFRLWIAAPHAYDDDVGLRGADDLTLTDSLFI